MEQIEIIFRILSENDNRGVSEKVAEYDARMVRVVENFNAQKGTYLDPLLTLSEYLESQESSNTHRKKK